MARPATASHASEAIPSSACTPHPQPIPFLVEIGILTPDLKLHPNYDHRPEGPDAK